MKLFVIKNWDILSWDRVRETLLGLKDWWYEINIEKRKDPRTLKQNSYIHAIFTLIWKELWYTLEEIKQLLKESFLSKKKYLKIWEKRKQIKKVKGTSELSKEEFSEFVEKIKIFCSWLWIIIENYEDFEKRF